MLVINDAVAASEANVRNFTNFEGENEIDQMAVESGAANGNMTAVMLNDTVATQARIERSGVIEADTGNAGENIDRTAEDVEEEDEAEDRAGAESKIRYSRFRKVIKSDHEEDRDDDHQPEAQKLIKVALPTREYLPTKSEINVEIIEDHNNGQFLKETVFVAAAAAAQPKQELEAPSRQFLKSFTGHTLSQDHSSSTTPQVPIALGLRLAPPKSTTSDENCDDHPVTALPLFQGQKTIVEVQKSVSVGETRRVTHPHHPHPSYRSGASRFVAHPPPSKCLTDCSTPSPIYLPIPAQSPSTPSPSRQVIVQDRPVVVVDRPVEVQVPVTKYVEKIVDRPVHVDRVVEKQVPVPYPVEVNKFIDRPYPVEKIVDRPVEVERVVEKQVPVPYPVERIVDRPVEVERIVEKEVQVAIPYPVEVNKYIDRPYPVEKIVETPVAVEVPVEVPVPHHIHHHHHHNPHPHEHLLHVNHHQHNHHPHHHVLKHFHSDPGQQHFDYAKSATTTLLKPVHKLLGDLWSKLQSPFFHQHHHQQTKHVTLPLYKTKYHGSDNHLYAGKEMRGNYVICNEIK